MTFLEELAAELKALRALGIEGPLAGSTVIDGVEYKVVLHDSEEEGE